MMVRVVKSLSLIQIIKFQFDFDRLVNLNLSTVFTLTTSGASYKYHTIVEDNEVEDTNLGGGMNVQNQ